MFKCANTECKFHKPLRGDEPSPLGDPVPFTLMMKVLRTTNKVMIPRKPSKLEDVTKRNHGMDFRPSAQTAVNVGMVIKCSKCKKPRLMYSKKIYRIL